KSSGAPARARAGRAGPRRVSESRSRNGDRPRQVRRPAQKRGLRVGRRARSIGVAAFAQALLRCQRTGSQCGSMVDTAAERLSSQAGRFWLPSPAVPPRHTWGRVLYLGFLAGPINQGFLFWGLERSTPIHAALFYALTPLGVYLYALLRRQERPSRRRVLGIAVAL